MQYKEGKYLTDHKTQKVMSSKPLNRTAERTQSLMQLANNQSNTKTVVRRVKKSDPSVFMGC